jgi:hypothetical protein
MASILAIAVDPAPKVAAFSNGGISLSIGARLAIFVFHNI